jgi:hypothetical protein
VREAHKPMSSALVFVPAPQFKNHFVVLDGWDLKVPPTPQHNLFDCAAPSKQAKVEPSAIINSHALNWDGLYRGRLPMEGGFVLMCI